MVKGYCPNCADSEENTYGCDIQVITDTVTDDGKTVTACDNCGFTFGVTA